MPLLLGIHAQIHRRIIHHRAHQTHRTGHVHVVEVFRKVQLTGFHVVVEAQRMPHLVHHQVVKRLLEVTLLALGIGAGGFEQLHAEQIIVLEESPRTAGTVVVRREVVAGIFIYFIQINEAGIVVEGRLLEAIRHKYIFQHDVGAQNLARAWVHEARPVATKRRIWR